MMQDEIEKSKTFQVIKGSQSRRGRSYMLPRRETTGLPEIREPENRDDIFSF